MLNVELKARCQDLGRLRETCISLGAEGQEPDRQLDTYFKVPHGRLKFRESLLSGAELIFYIRADVVGARESHYETCPVEAADGMKAVLEKALGVRAVVVKRREVFVIGAVRIHLDKVQDLGTFVELEGIVDDPAELTEVADEVQRLGQALGVEDRSLIKESYADLIGVAEEGRAARSR
jgi:adenylate cyclase class 2